MRSLPQRSSGWHRLLPRDAATNLAVFRIVVAALFLTTGEIRAAASWASLSPALVVPPRGWAWALALFPPNVTISRLAQVVMIAGSTLGLVGCFSRAAFACLTIASLYLLALPLGSGMPYHYQHLVWFAALCAVSRCGDALSIDRLRRHDGEMAARPRSAAYGVPLRAAWVLIGAIFFFPGLWKLRASGLAWITSDNLRNQLYWKWAITPSFSPPFRIDHFPRLLHVGAAAVVALELSFAFAIWWRPSRIIAVVTALGFHAFAALFMGIDFSALWLTYVVFVDWDALANRWSPPRTARAPGDAASELRRAAPALLVGATLVVGAVEAGLRGATVGWPFACYPTFQERAGTVMPALALAVVRSAGDEHPLDVDAGLLPADWPRERVFGLGLIASANGSDAASRFAAYWQRLAARAPWAANQLDLRAVRFYAATLSTLPEARGQPPHIERLLYELVLTPPATMMPRARNGSTTSRSSDAAASVR